MFRHYHKSYTIYPEGGRRVGISYEVNHQVFGSSLEEVKKKINLFLKQRN